MSEPTDVNLIAKVLDWGWAGVLALGGLVWKGQNEKLAAVNFEVNTQRQNIAKLFDKLEEHGRRSEDRHREVLNALHSGLDRKADK
jgi:F420-0:gamma-glutamyl ligase-like protein